MLYKDWNSFTGDRMSGIDPFHPAMNLLTEPSITFEQAIAHLNLRKQNLDHILEIRGQSRLPSRPTEELHVREDEIDRALEILRRVKP